MENLEWREGLWASILVLIMEDGCQTPKNQILWAYGYISVLQSAILYLVLHTYQLSLLSFVILQFYIVTCLACQYYNFYRGSSYSAFGTWFGSYDYKLFFSGIFSDSFPKIQKWL